MLVALVLFPVLILGDQWHSTQIVDLRHDARAASSRWLGGRSRSRARSPMPSAAGRSLLPLAIVAALPFRVPLHAGGDTANLLVPLYLVIAAGVLAAALRDWRDSAGGSCRRRDHAGGSCGRTRRQRLAAASPAAVVVLYAVQALYSEDFSKGLQNVCFFFVPFSLVYGLLRDVKWDRRLLTLVLWVVGIEAVCFVLVGSVEFVTKSLFWNDQVIRSNEFHTYFRVNSVFWDPNIYGRYLSLVAVVAMSALLWARERKTLALLTALDRCPLDRPGADLLAVELRCPACWPGCPRRSALELEMDRDSRGRRRRPDDARSSPWPAASASTASTSTPSGRANLVSGGVHLFAQRPIYGYGSGSFPKAYRKHVKTRKAPVSVSHTEPITVAAEQGLLGLALYVALVVTALWTMATGLRPRCLAGRLSRGWHRGGPPRGRLATGGGPLR